jgi:hypothetical protein
MASVAVLSGSAASGVSDSVPEISVFTHKIL